MQAPGRAQPTSRCLRVGTPQQFRWLYGIVQCVLVLNLVDAVRLLSLLSEDRFALPCGGSAVEEGGNRVLLDLNGDARVNISDPVYLLLYLFQNGLQPARGTDCIRIEGCANTCR